MFDNRRWQPVPGTREMQIYPICRKPDVCCSNAYILQEPGAIVLIDSGARDDQADEIARTIGALQDESPRPVAVIFSHCHIDHVFQAANRPEMTGPGTATYIAHHLGAEALAQADRARTAADLFGWDLPPCRVDLPLVFDGNAAPQGAGPVQVIPAEPGPSPSLRLRIGDGEWFTVSHAPGHSPDSITVRVGGALFVGDIPFASQPVIAGIVGWDREEFCRTVPSLLELLDGEQIRVCCPGHGNPVDAGDARKMLEYALKTAERTGSATFDQVVLRESIAQAEELLVEAHRLFSIIIGRLLYLGWWMEELGEEEAAERYMALVDADRIDAILADFGQYVDRFRTGEYIGLQVVLKAVQVLQRISRTFAAEHLDHLIDPSLLRRADRLMTDFLNTVGGLSCPGSPEEVPLPPLLEAVAVRCREGAADDAILSAVDDPDRFSDALAERIVRIPVCRELVVDCPDLLPPVRAADPLRLEDLVMGVIEELSADGVTRVSLTARPSGTGVVVEIDGDRPVSWREERARILGRQGTLCGADLAVDCPVACTITLPRAEVGGR